MLDLAIVLVFVAVSVAAGVVSSAKAGRSLDEFFLAGKTLAGWQAGTSMAATQFAADTPLVVMGLVATAGIFALWQLWVYGLAFLGLAFVFSSHWQRASVLTDAELTEIRYSGREVLGLRALKAVYYGTVINCIVLAMVLKATVSVAEVFLLWHLWLPEALYGPLRTLVAATGVTVASGLTPLDPVVASTNNLLSVVLILGFVGGYSMTGGLRGVVFTDVIQFALAMVGTFALAGYVVAEAGGLSGLTGRVLALYPETGRRMLGFIPPPGAALTPFLVIMSLQWVFQVSSDGTGYLAQRSMSCRDERQARVAGVVFAWLQIFGRSLPWLLIAVGLLVVFPFRAADVAAEGFRASREMTFVRGIDELLPPGIRGVLLVGMLAALASTLDTHMNWGASYWANDLYKRVLCGALLKREPRDRELVRVARASNLLLVALALAIVPLLDSIQQAWKLSLLYGAGVGSVLVMRWLWERINIWSEIAAMGVSLAFAPALLWWTGGGNELEWLRLLAMAVVSTAAAVGAGLLTRPTEDATLDEFYRRVQPVGFWETTRARLRDSRQPRRELAMELRATAAAGASLFLSLYGAGRLLVPHPAVPRWLPGVALAAGLALVPLWWRLGLGPRDDA